MLEWLKSLLGSLNIKFPENISGAIKFVFKIGSENKITKIENVNIFQIRSEEHTSELQSH